jgi:hypothetical protein
MQTYTYRVSLDLAENQPGASTRVIQADFSTRKKAARYFNSLTLHVQCGTLTLALVIKDFEFATERTTETAETIQTLHCNVGAVVDPAYALINHPLAGALGL